MRGPFPRAAIWLLAAGLAGVSACGCVHNRKPYVSASRLDHGLVVILPGIEGPSVYNAAIRKGLMDHKLPYAMEIHNWVGWRLGASYAFDLPACRRKAGRVADRVIDYRGRYPGRPVFLVGHSGGGAIAIFAAEAIASRQPTTRPAEHRRSPLTGVILLAPALSPGYDLTTAIDACGGRMVNCYTETDVMLRTATTVGRNLDGVPGPTAGQDGFSPPAGAGQHRRDAFASLRQIKWDRSMIKQRNFGGHLGWTSPQWVNEALGPIVERWAEEK